MHIKFFYSFGVLSNINLQNYVVYKNYEAKIIALKVKMHPSFAKDKDVYYDI